MYGIIADSISFADGLVIATDIPYIGVTEGIGFGAMKVFTASEIKAIRDRLGMTQAEFAAAFHLNVRTLQDWEAERVQVTGATAVLLWLIGKMPRQIQKALRTYDDRPGGARK